MAHKNPVVVSTDGKKHETLGDGNTLAPGSIPISAESGNGLSVKSDGLFSTSGGGGGGLTSVSHNNSLSGSGTTESPLAVKISGRDGNALKLLDLTTTEGGLFAASGGNVLADVVTTRITTATNSEAVQTAIEQALVSNPTSPVNTTWEYVTYNDYPEQRGSVSLTIIPTETGKYIALGGDKDRPVEGLIGQYWVSKSGDVTVIYESNHNGAGEGGSVGYGEPTIITDATDLGVVEAKYNDLLNDKTITKGVAYHYAQVTSGGEAVEYAGQGVMLSAIPAGDGVIATYAGVMAGSNKQMLRIRYSDGTNTALLVENTLERTLNTDATLTGNGDVSSALGVQVSADSQNELTVLQPENSDTPGLFARPISAMLFAADDSIVKTSNYQGNPKNAAINVRVSSRENNALKLIPNSESSSERGLFVPPTQSLKRGTGGGNFSFGYPDNKSAKNACGKMGTGVYWKVTISLDNAGAGNVAVMPRIWTNNIPCMEDGTLVPYQIVTDYVTANNNAVPSVAVWLICMGVPTHLMSVTDGTMKKLQRSDNGLTNGLDDLYPLAPEGEYSQEPQWRREYFYTA